MTRRRGRLPAGPRATRLLGSLLLATALVGTAGCARPSAPAGPALSAARHLVVPVDADADATARRIAGLARGADVIYLGEQHDNAAHHARQLAVLRALLAEGLRPALAFEMLDRGAQPAVDSAVAEASDRDDLARRLGWQARGWPDFSMYWPLFDVARRDRLPVLAIDLEPALVRRIARGGQASLAQQGEGLGSLLSPDQAREDAVARTIRDSHCGLLPESRLPFMVQAWHARNATMARQIAAALDRGRPVVVIIGRGHQDAGGLPAQLAALRPGTRQFVLSLVEAPFGAGARASAEASTADVVWLTAAVDRDDPCAGLRRPAA